MLDQSDMVDRLRKNQYSVELIGSAGGWVGIIRIWDKPYDKPDIEIMRTWDRHPTPEEALQNCLEWANKQIE